MTFTFDVLTSAPAAANTDVSNRATIIYDGATRRRAAGPPVHDRRGHDRRRAVRRPRRHQGQHARPGRRRRRRSRRRSPCATTGPSPATDVVVTDELPAGLGAVTATSTQGTLHRGGRARDVRARNARDRRRRHRHGAGGRPAGLDRGHAHRRRPGHQPDRRSRPRRQHRRRVDRRHPQRRPVGHQDGVPGDGRSRAVRSPTRSPSTNNGPSTATSVVIDDAVPDPGIEPHSAIVGPGRHVLRRPQQRPLHDRLAGAGRVGRDDRQRHRPPERDAAAPSPTTPSCPRRRRTATRATTRDREGDDRSRRVRPRGRQDRRRADAADRRPRRGPLHDRRHQRRAVRRRPGDGDRRPAARLRRGLGDQPIAARARSQPAPTAACPATSGRLVAPFGDDATARPRRITIVAQVPADVAPGTYPNVATADAPSSPPTSSPPAPVDRRGPRQRVDRQVVPAGL